MGAVGIAPTGLVIPTTTVVRPQISASMRTGLATCCITFYDFLLLRRTGRHSEGEVDEKIY